MKHITLLLCLYLGFASLASAQQVIEVSEVGKDRFETDFAAGGRLRLDLRSGEIRISGTDDNKISVHFEGEDAEKFDNVKVSFKNSNGTGHLSVTGGPRNHFRIILEVPKTLDLYVRVPFGETEIEGITGNKDVEMHAGDLTISVGSDSDYSHVDASVSSGELDASPWNIEKGGLFRSFERQGSGQYRLHAHVGAGQLTLR